MLADFWTMAPRGTWPPISVLFGIVVGLVLASAWHSYKKNRYHQGEDGELHFHEDSKGVVHACYHACKQQNLFFSRMYWISLTLAFPLEHIVYHKLWPFYLLSNWLNIS